MKYLSIVFILTLSLMAPLISRASDFFDFKSDLKLEVLYASATTKNIESVFGHMAIRMTYLNSQKESQDYVLTFIANTDGEQGVKQILKGIFGAYPTVALLEPYEQYLKRTTIDEDRRLRRFILPSNDDIAKNLISKLNDMNENKIKLGNYEFFSKNCATNMYDFLAEIGFYTNRLHKRGPFLSPSTYVPMYLQPVLLGLIELDATVSKRDLISAVIQKTHLKVSEEGIQNPVQLEKNLPSLNIKDLNFLLLFPFYKNAELRKAILKELKGRPGLRRLGLSEIVQDKTYPQALYRLCIDMSCAQQAMQVYQDLFGQQRRGKFKDFIRSEMRRSEQLFFHHELKSTPQFQHAHFLLKYL